MELIEYKPSLLFRNHHINTIFSSRFRKVKKPLYTRKRYDTLDKDFIDIDVLEGTSNKCMVLL